MHGSCIKLIAPTCVVSLKMSYMTPKHVAAISDYIFVCQKCTIVGAVKE
jgi:spore maturation protein SpmA